ncbi:MAG: hypothetical protein GX345_01235 [Clostridiales bacterium]|nr:hypothetical protein [Clostridiales bacterium]
MKKVLVLTLALSFLLAACSFGKSEEASEPDTLESQFQTQGDTQETAGRANESTGSRQTELETEAPSENKEDFFNTYGLFQERDFIGRPLSQALEKYGENYEQGGFSGSWTFMYDEITFLISALEDIDESQPITHIIVYGKKQDAQGRPYSKNYAELKELLPQLEEPSYNILDETYVSSIDDGLYHYAFYWSDSDYLNENFVSVIIGKLGFEG